MHTGGCHDRTHHIPGVSAGRGTDRWPYPEAVVTAYQGPDPVNEALCYASRTTRRSQAIALANELVAEIREAISARPDAPAVLSAG